MAALRKDDFFRNFSSDILRETKRRRVFSFRLIEASISRRHRWLLRQEPPTDSRPKKRNPRVREKIPPGGKNLNFLPPPVPPSHTTLSQIIKKEKGKKSFFFPLIFSGKMFFVVKYACEKKGREGNGRKWLPSLPFPTILKEQKRNNFRLGLFILPPFPPLRNAVVDTAAAWEQRSGRNHFRARRNILSLLPSLSHLISIFTGWGS